MNLSAFRGDRCSTADVVRRLALRVAKVMTARSSQRSVASTRPGKEQIGSTESVPLDARLIVPRPVGYPWLADCRSSPANRSGEFCGGVSGDQAKLPKADSVQEFVARSQKLLRAISVLRELPGARV